MSIRNLTHLFQPASIAVVGASTKPHSVGETVLTNLLNCGFTGSIFPVNPKYHSISGTACYRSVSRLPVAPDLAVICTPPDTVPQLITELGERGTKAAIVLTAGLSRARDADGRSLQDAMLQAARPYLLRILGPNCVGLMVPGIGLNASFAHAAAKPGKLAFISQSGALTTAVLDWAFARDIGFSHFISLGDSADVDLGDVLDYLAGKADTRAILLYVESVRNARKFMSAARAAARNKPVIVVKAGRVPEGAKAAASHTGALAGADDVYDAAIRRAGMLRVNTTDQLFDAVETLARAKPLSGDRLAIMTNGGGAGVMATDALILGGGHLASLDQESVRRLDEILPPTWSHGNPVDMIGDAPVERYLETLKVLLDDAGSDAVLFIHAPTAIVPSSDIALALTATICQSPRNVFSCWLGAEAVSQARRSFREAGSPSYETPEQAVGAFMQAVEYRRNQEALMETPSSTPDAFMPDATARARAVVQDVLASGRSMLTEPEAKDVLAAYGIPVVETRIARTADDAVAVAESLGMPVAVKILSPDITHKSDVGGVALDLETAEQVRSAVQAMEKRVRERHPAAQLRGFTVQRMARRPRAFELIVGAATDLVFGPVILFGQGGTAVEVIGDRAVGLPPLNMRLARDLVSRTRIAKLLAGYRDRPPVDLDAVCLVLTQISQLMCDIPEIVELDINPLWADEVGVLALDARIGVAQALKSGTDRLAILPYPAELEQHLEWNGKPIVVRPIRPEDEPRYSAFFSTLAPEDIHYRFFCMIRQPAHAQLARITQIDYDREMSFIAIARENDGEEHVLGEARAVADPDNLSAEFAIIVRSDLKGKGLGRLLMDTLIRYGRQHGTGALEGLVLPENRAMLKLAKDCGFVVDQEDTADGIRLRLVLQ
ncbi:bifunctional acetate--CoA ligase family protein/GNAT family N-acetyltransferase [Cupriavidus necator]